MLEKRGGVIIAVSLNVVNASNSISWDYIEEAMNFFDLLEYLQRDPLGLLPGLCGPIHGLYRTRGNLSVLV